MPGAPQPTLPQHSPTFGDLPALPRGPHGLTRDEVEAVQRTRLLAAMVAAVAENGYAATTITATTRRAAVSPNVFYAHFADKEECFLAAYGVFVDALLTGVGEAIASAPEWSEFVGAAVRAYLGALDADRPAARAFLLEMDAAGRDARVRRHEAFASFAAVLRERHRLVVDADPALTLLPDRAYLGLALGVRGLVCDALDDPSTGSLLDLAADVERWLNATMRPDLS